MRYLWLVLAVLLSLPVTTPAWGQTDYPSSYNGQPQGWRGAMSAHDQQEFDKYYSKWVDATRKNDRDDIAGNARHMQDIMARYNIPATVPFDQVATNAAAGAYSPYPNGAYAGAYSANQQVRLSPEDQQKFDKYYVKWVDAQRKNDRDDIEGNARHMQDIMARYNIPATVPFQAIATNGYAAAPAATYPNTYGYTQPVYGYAAGAQRLSSKDQRDFDKYYRKWEQAKRKKDMDDVDHNARKMQDIMARYNIPANVSFSQIAAEGGELYR